MGTEFAKLLLKVIDDRTGHGKWLHLCYIPEDLFNEYKKNRPQDVGNMNGTLSRWAKEDFGRDIFVNTVSELETLKVLVRDYCKEAYPEVYLDQSTDRQGWLRVWISKKMKEELENNGE